MAGSPPTPGPGDLGVPALEHLVRVRAERLAARDEPHVADAGRLVHLTRLPATVARHADLAVPLHPEVAARIGVDRLYTHQAEALDLVRAGTSVVVATSTSSGKSLVHQAAIGEAAQERVRPGTALCLFPTKALARDQLRALASMDLPGVVPAAYDGDTGRDERAVELLRPLAAGRGQEAQFARYYLALALTRLGMSDEARAAFARLDAGYRAERLTEDARQRADDMPAQVRAARANLEADQPEAARDLLEAAVQRLGPDREALRTLAECYDKLGRADLAADARRRADQTRR